VARRGDSVQEIRRKSLGKGRRCRIIEGGRRWRPLFQQPDCRLGCGRTGETLARLQSSTDAALTRRDVHQTRPILVTRPGQVAPRTCARGRALRSSATPLPRGGLDTASSRPRPAFRTARDSRSQTAFASGRMKDSSPLDDGTALDVEIAPDGRDDHVPVELTDPTVPEPRRDRGVTPPGHDGGIHGTHPALVPARAVGGAATHRVPVAAWPPVPSAADRGIDRLPEVSPGRPPPARRAGAGCRAR
jgi:hypothetical protein